MSCKDCTGCTIPMKKVYWAHRSYQCGDIVAIESEYHSMRGLHNMSENGFNATFYGADKEYTTRTYLESSHDDLNIFSMTQKKPTKNFNCGGPSKR